MRTQRKIMRVRRWLPVAALAGIGLAGSLQVTPVGIGIGPTAAWAAREEGEFGADFVPRRQQQRPHPARSPEEALKHWTVPEGFKIELVASEPTLVNPVNMTIDERGRFWIVESVEYPRREAGPGRDRIRVLEDTTGDGRIDKNTIFADGFNIPSGIAVGYGGVWISNAPDILFLQDTTGDGKADKKEVVVTGFGRDDTHELPNSFTWGPDGWLYALNGVFNRSQIEQDGQVYGFDAAIFRIHPVTREFQVFAEGTSNPWGIAFNPDGNMFISACVIDHLWHVTERGYYVRQAGSYPAHTWRMDSIVKHRHHMAAFCGLVYFDSDAYPAPYRDTLFMGNVHGGKLNADVLERRGATYFARPHEQRVFIQANDVWHIPVDQKVGPDGLLYVLDWYDRYHCYQDAQRDPEGVDRQHGRLWRLNHVDAKPAGGPAENMGELSDQTLIERLHSANIYHRETAQRLLGERMLYDKAEAETRRKLEALVLDAGTEHKPRMHALYSMLGSFELHPEFHLALFDHDVTPVRAWAVRSAGNFAGEIDSSVFKRALAMTRDPAPDVLLQAAIAAPKLVRADAVTPLAQVLAAAGNDLLIPQIVWQNLHPLLGEGMPGFMAAIADVDWQASEAVRRVMPRVTDFALARADMNPEVIARLVRLLLENQFHGEARQTLAALSERVRSGEVRGQRLQRVREAIEPVLDPIIREGVEAEMFFDAAVTAATWQHEGAVAAVANVARNEGEAVDHRIAAINALVISGPGEVLGLAESLLGAPEGVPQQLKRGIIHAISRLDAPRVGKAIVAGWETYGASTRVTAIETLTQRGAWSLALLDAIAEERIPREALHQNQILSIHASGDPGVVERVEQTFGRVRAERNPQRQEVIQEIYELAHRKPGDPIRGREVFMHTCSACHTMHGQGTPLGPDITRNGRGSFDQLLSNVFDPNLIVNAGYQLRTVMTRDGRAVAGMIVEEDDQRLVVEMIGGLREVIAAGQVANVVTSPVSFMPEGLELAMTDEEIVDLLAFLSLTGPPEDPESGLIPGAPAPADIDPARIELPGSVENLLVRSRLSSNIAEWSAGRVRGQIGDMVWDPVTRRFIRDSQWHEYGVGFQENVGVVPEENPIYWQAEWDEPVRANLIVLSGSYENQPQAKTFWRIELRTELGWVTHDEGIGGWLDRRRYVWGGPGLPRIEFDAIRVSVHSPDEKTPVVSLTFRGEPTVSWVVADVAEGLSIEK